MTTEEAVKEIIKLAKRAAKAGEVPVGALIIGPDGKVLGRGVNKTHAHRDGLMHAEMVAIKRAEKKLADWRLDQCEIYITLEPCLMCLGAIGNARISRVYYLLEDPLFGSLVSKLTAAQVGKLFPKLKFQKLAGGDEIKQIMADFFKDLRRRGKRITMGQSS